MSANIISIDSIKSMIITSQVIFLSIQMKKFIPDWLELYENGNTLRKVFIIIGGFHQFRVRQNPLFK